MTHDITVIGSNMMELTTDIDRMPKLGETVSAPSFQMAFGPLGERGLTKLTPPLN